MDAGGAAAAQSRPRMANACEACRAAKVKCQTSSQPGICRRCFDSKRECIFKLGPRPRRPRRTKLQQEAGLSRGPPPPGPSKTFTIDIPMPPEIEFGDDNYSMLSQSHGIFLDDLDSSGGSDSEYLSADEPSVAHSGISNSTGSSLPLGASALSTPPSSIAGTGFRLRPPRSVHSLGVQPQFNVDSAEGLLASFRDSMLDSFPCIALPADTTVAELSRTRPFVLLAILASASGTRSMQGHSLYDEEFRKVLGLKFVAGGERSLEMLQSLIVYCAWYPFHLRPKNKQLLQYVRMVVDLVHDLDLDEELSVQSLELEEPADPYERLRTYLAAYFLSSTTNSGWSKNGGLTYTDFTSKCSFALEKSSPLRGDHILSWLARLQHIIEETGEMRKKHGSNKSYNEHQLDLMLKGMEAQLNEWWTRIPPNITSTPAITIANYFAHFFLSGASLLTLTRAAGTSRIASRKQDDSTTSAQQAESARLVTVIPTLRAFFDYMLGLSRSDYAGLSSIQWMSLVLAIILSFRMSFPLPSVGGWNDAQCRADLDFGGYLRRFVVLGDGDGEGPNNDSSNAGGNLAPGGTAAPPPPPRHGLDILEVFKIVLRTVQKKYERRLARLERRPCPRHAAPGEPMDTAGAGIDYDAAASIDPMRLDRSVSGCPMLDKETEQQFALWQQPFQDPFSNPPLEQQQQQQQATGGDVELDASGVPQPAVFHDLWATMTMSWAQDGLSDMSGLNNMGSLNNMAGLNDMNSLNDVDFLDMSLQGTK